MDRVRGTHGCVKGASNLSCAHYIDITTKNTLFWFVGFSECTTWEHVYSTLTNAHPDVTQPYTSPGEVPGMPHPSGIVTKISMALTVVCGVGGG